MKGSFHYEDHRPATIHSVVSFFDNIIDFCAFFRFAPSCNARGHYKLFTEQSTHNARYHFSPDVLLVRGIDSLSILTFLL